MLLHGSACLLPPHQWPWRVVHGICFSTLFFFFFFFSVPCPCRICVLVLHWRPCLRPPPPTPPPSMTWRAGYRNVFFQNFGFFPPCQVRVTYVPCFCIQAPVCDPPPINDLDELTIVIFFNFSLCASNHVRGTFVSCYFAHGGDQTEIFGSPDRTVLPSTILSDRDLLLLPWKVGSLRL